MGLRCGVLFLRAPSGPCSVQQCLSLNKAIPNIMFGGEGQLIGLKARLAFFFFF